MKKTTTIKKEQEAFEKSFFLGANSSQGFVSFFDELTDVKRYEDAFIIKGGPGTGKSTLMRNIAKTAQNKGFETEYIYCSSDPDSLDGIIINDLKKIVADGTPPHIIEPKYPGAFEKTININSLFNNKLLKENKEKIVNLLDKNKQLHNRTGVFLAAAGSLKGDSKRIASFCTKFDKIQRYADNFIKNNITKKAESTYNGIESKRFLSAVSNKGFVFFKNTIYKCADTIYNIEDPYGVVSSYLLHAIKNSFMKNGYNVYGCYCPLSPNEQLEHLIVPEMKLAFVTTNNNHSISKIDSYRNINFKRFCDNELLISYRNRLNFNKKAIAQLLEQAINIEIEAKLNHDEIEDIYTKAVDFEKNNEFFKKAINMVFTD